MTPWRDAMENALYGADGFFTRQAPADHFRTSATASPLFATALARLLARVDEALDRPGRLDVLDVGAGRAELLVGLAAALPPRVRERARFVAVERAARPTELPDWIEWRADVPEGVTGVLLAAEWLDNVPVDVVEADDAGQPRQVRVDPRTGAESLGDAPRPEAQEWLRRWWPLSAPGDRAEVGGPRDAAWADAVRAVRRGAALAVDYGHFAGSRPFGGTLVGYRDGRQTAPVPDGSCDLTAHVAFDAAAAAGEQVAGPAPQLIDQRTALRSLEVTGARPPLALASTDPTAYVRALASATQAAELIDLHGLGGHWWLLQPVAAAISLG